MRELQIFKNEKENFKIRSIVKNDGSIWFYANDVGDCLDITNVRENLRSLLEEDKTKILLKPSEMFDLWGNSVDVSSNHTHINDNRGKYYTFISKEGVFELILMSRKPDALKFKRWITKEILPSIFDTGKYELTDAKKLIQNRKDNNTLFKSSIKQSKQLRGGVEKFYDYSNPADLLDKLVFGVRKRDYVKINGDFNGSLRDKLATEEDNKYFPILEGYYAGLFSKGYSHKEIVPMMEDFWKTLKIIKLGGKDE